MLFTEKMENKNYKRKSKLLLNMLVVLHS